MWACWIPILTASINYKERFENFINKNKKEIKKNSNFYFYERGFDDIDKNSKWDIKIDKNYNSDFPFTKLILKKDNYQYLVKILKAQSNGIIFYEIFNPNNEIEINEKLAKQIYVILKDFFHEHTHHHKDDDMLLVPVEINNNFLSYNTQQELVANLILKQYSEKIILYHKYINSHYNFYLINELTEIIKKSIGEMIYATHFLDLNKNYLSEKDYWCYNKSFNHTLKSFENLLNIYSFKASLQSNKLNNFNNIFMIISILLIIFSQIINNLWRDKNLIIETIICFELIIFSVLFVHYLPFNLTSVLLEKMIKLIAFAKRILLKLKRISIK